MELINNNTLFASQSLLQAFADANACSLIPENKSCKLFSFHNKKIVVIGSSSSGANGVHYVSAYECVLLENNDGIKMSYDEHRLAVYLKERERGYTGVIIKSDSKKWVIIGSSFTIKPVKEDVQLAFF